MDFVGLVGEGYLIHGGGGHCPRGPCRPSLPGTYAERRECAAGRDTVMWLGLRPDLHAVDDASYFNNESVCLTRDVRASLTA